MRYQIITQSAAAIDQPPMKVRLYYAARARTEEQRRQRREALWAALSLVVLVLCWDLSARLDERALPEGHSMAAVGVATAGPAHRPGTPRRLRKLSEEAGGEAPKSYEWIK
jgi:hypothetical protein